MNGKLVNSKTFESLKIIKYWSWWARKIATIMIWKKLKITVEQKSFQRDQLEKGKKHILDGPQSGFPLKMDNYKSIDLSLQIRIVNSTSFMISTMGQVILVTQKQCQLLLGEPQHKKKLMHVSFDMGFKTVLRTLHKNVIVVKYKVVCHLT